MTDDRTLERAARSWIEIGPTRAPQEAVETALRRIQTTPQERDWLPWRTREMFTPTRVALAAVIGALVIGGVYLTLDRLRPSAVGTPSATPTPTPAPSASVRPSQLTPQAMPQTLRGDWQAEASEILQNVADPGEQIQLSLDWDTGESAWIQPPRGANVYQATSVEAPDGELALLEGPSLVGCAPGSIGRYGWERSADGFFLTLTVISDDCPGRAAAYGRTWVHSLSAVTDGGIGVLPWDGRWIQATLPSMRFGLSGATDVADLQSFDASDPDIGFIVMADPTGASDPCASDGGEPLPIVTTTDGFVDYVSGLPGAEVTTEATTVGGLPAVHVTVDLARTTDCPLAQVAAFQPRLPGEDVIWSLTTDATHSLWVVRDGDGILLFWYEGEGVTPADQRAVMDSIAILDELPTP